MGKYFNPDETYDSAIKNKEIGVLRALLTGILGSDPTFATSEFQEARNYIRKKSIELNGEELAIEEVYIKQEDEVEKDVNDWDELYFQMNLVWLRDNFNLSNRLYRLKEIGKKVYKDKTTLGKSKIENCGGTSAPLPKTREGGWGESKKASVAKTTAGGSSDHSRLSGGVFEWVKNNWHWIIVIIVILLMIFTGLKRCGADDKAGNKLSVIDVQR